MAVESKAYIDIEEIRSRFKSKSRLNESTLYESILPIYYISKVFGLTCVAKESVDGKLRFKKSKIGPIVNAVWLIVVICVGVITSIYLHEINVTFMSKFSVILSLFNLFSLVVLGFCCLFGARCQKKFIACVTNLNLIDDALASLSIYVPHEKNRRFIVKLIAYSIVIVIVLMIIDVLLMSFDNLMDYDHLTPTATQNLAIWFTYCIPELLNIILECQILIWILGIKQRFKLLNKKLSQITSDFDDILVKKISEIHADLCQISRRANALHSLQILFVILTHFLNVLITVYSAVLIHVMGKSNGRETKSVAFFVSYWLAWYFTKIVLLCKYCGEVGSNQSQTTGVLVHRALGRTTDSQVQKQLMMFSSQLIHSRVNITASQFFDVDLKLVAPLAGAMATYLIIIVQFEMATHASDCSELAVNQTI